MTEDNHETESKLDKKVTNFGIEDILSNKFGSDQIELDHDPHKEQISNQLEQKKRLLWPAWVYCTRFFKDLFRVTH